MKSTESQIFNGGGYNSPLILLASSSERLLLCASQLGTENETVTLNGDLDW